MRRTPLYFGLTQRKGKEKSTFSLSHRQKACFMLWRKTSVEDEGLKFVFQQTFSRLSIRTSSSTFGLPKTFRSLQNRGLTRKKVKLGSASNKTFFLRDSHDSMAGFSTMAFPPPPDWGRQNALKAQCQSTYDNTLGNRELQTNALE